MSPMQSGPSVCSRAKAQHRTGEKGAACPPRPPGAGVPGGVYLCQVDDGLSCGACCGLYNLQEADEDRLLQMLQQRTEAFALTPRQIEALTEFGRKITERLGDRLPVSGFHHCPFLGLIGEDRTRVGCLLHPLGQGNDGVDFRGLSHYGGMACRIYFCPSHESLAPAWKKIVQKSAGGWYLYGLVITEDKLLAGFFGAIEEAIGRPLTEEDVAEDPVCASALQEFFRLKCTWPHRPADIPGPVNYFFNDRQRTRPAVVYPPSCSRPAPYDAIFRALGTAFETEAAIREAEGRIRRPISIISERIRNRSQR
ncbi:MAG: hypothetical protein K9L59_05560 [Desulfobacterales bacterium]|nr:hypothetical protein [Desulfobacterales bacterium]MCF8080084.1 hypothetical protein [Desulfobacterales bacterium]